MKAKVIAMVTLTLMVGLLSAQNMYGAFQIKTDPKGATITLQNSNQYIGNTPSQVFPVLMDQYTSFSNGIPGRTISLLIAKEGFITLEQDIFVPYNHTYQQDAIDNPIVFHFELNKFQTPPTIYIPQPCPPPAIQWYYSWPRPHHNDHDSGWWKPHFPRRHHGHNGPRPPHKP